METHELNPFNNPFGNPSDYAQNGSQGGYVANTSFVEYDQGYQQGGGNFPHRYTAKLIK